MIGGFVGEARGGCPEQAKICCNFIASSEFDNRAQGIEP